MIISILGKGGVGKSTIASQIAMYFSNKGNKVLAIDADYNMDLVFNICNGYVPENISYFGASKVAMKSFLSLDVSARYADDVARFDNHQFLFSKDKIDDYTQSVTFKVSDNLIAAVCGPETDDILYGKSCGHSLSAPLKLYLPLLHVGENCHVVIDEKAGSDGANSGIISGCDLLYIVTDSSLHGIKTAKQIAKLAQFFCVPYKFIANKIRTDEDLDYVSNQLEDPVSLCFSFDKKLGTEPGHISELNNNFFNEINNLATSSDNKTRLERSKRKFKVAEKKFL